MAKVKLLGYKNFNYTKERIEKEHQEKLEYEEQEMEMQQEEYFLFKLLRLSLKFLRFSLYLCVTVLEQILQLIRVVFLNEYRPFEDLMQELKDKRELKQEKQVNEYLAKNRGAKLEHTYEFKHSEAFSNSYKILVERINQVAYNNLNLNEELRQDSINRLNLIIQECESVGLEEGYKYAKETNFKYNNDEIYNYFICDRVHRNI